MSVSSDQIIERLRVAEQAKRHRVQQVRLQGLKAEQVRLAGLRRFGVVRELSFLPRPPSR